MPRIGVESMLYPVDGRRLSHLGHDATEEAHHDAARGLAADRDVKVDLQCGGRRQPTRRNQFSESTQSVLVRWRWRI